MNVSPATLWWIAAGVAVVAELATGTFYLLMIALGMAAGAFAAYLGFPLGGQIVVASLLGGGATAVWHWRRARRPGSAAARENRDVNLDIGERVIVEVWDANRTARVQYRGSTWTARLAPGAPDAAGMHLVTAVEGNWLVLAPLPKVTRPTD